MGSMAIRKRAPVARRSYQLIVTSLILFSVMGGIVSFIPWEGRGNREPLITGHRRRDGKSNSHQFILASKKGFAIVCMMLARVNTRRKGARCSGSSCGCLPEDWCGGGHRSVQYLHPNASEMPKPMRVAGRIGFPPLSGTRNPGERFAQQCSGIAADLRVIRGPRHEK